MRRARFDLVEIPVADEAQSLPDALEVRVLLGRVVRSEAKLGPRDGRWRGGDGIADALGERRDALRVVAHDRDLAGPVIDADHGRVPSPRRTREGAGGTIVGVPRPRGSLHRPQTLVGHDPNPGRLGRPSLARIGSRCHADAHTHAWRRQRLARFDGIARDEAEAGVVGMRCRRGPAGQHGEPRSRRQSPRQNEGIGGGADHAGEGHGASVSTAIARASCARTVAGR